MTAMGAAQGLTAKGMSTRARIVKVAAELIFERGVGDTSMRTSVTGRGSAPRRFITTSVIDTAPCGASSTAEAAAQCATPGSGGLDSIAALRAWARSHVKLQEQRHCVGGCAFGSLVGQVSEIEPETCEDFRVGFSTWQQPIADGLEAMRRRGELRPRGEARGPRQDSRWRRCRVGWCSLKHNAPIAHSRSPSRPPSTTSRASPSPLRPESQVIEGALTSRARTHRGLARDRLTGRNGPSYASRIGHGIEKYWTADPRGSYCDRDHPRWLLQEEKPPELERIVRPWTMRRHLAAPPQ